MKRALLVMLAACGGSNSSTGDDGAGSDAAAADVMTMSDAAASSSVGTVSGVTDVTCPQGAPPGATCKTITVAGCPGIETESLNATIAILPTNATLKGTIVHFSGGPGAGFQTAGAQQYATGGFRQVFVSWASAWEQTQSLGIKAGGCRPATVLRWIFDEPTLHASSRSLAFCGEGFSGGSGQLGYALAQYGLGDYLDYVNELSGPPFTRIDLGCDGSAPATAMVCGATVTMKLPAMLDSWENIQSPLTCGSTNVPATELDRWKNDSIAIGGVYAYPKTRVEFFDCTNNATAVTAMAQLYHDTITSDKAYHCYSQADGCQGEGLGTGNAQAVQAMLAGCTPRHQ